MKINCVPLTSFIHGSLTASEGRALLIEEQTAKELERAGLIRIGIDAKPKATAGKGSDDGSGQLSSALPVALPSGDMKTTSNSSADGKSKTLKGGR